MAEREDPAEVSSRLAKERWAKAVEEAQRMAKAIGHAVALCHVGQGKYQSYDSWKELPHGASKKALVSVSGVVVRS